MQRFKLGTWKGNLRIMLSRKNLSTAEVAELIEVSPRTITLWAAAWQDTGGREGIPGFKIGKKLWKFDPVQIEQWLLDQKGCTVPERSAIPAIPTPIRKTGSSR